MYIRTGFFYVKNLPLFILKYYIAFKYGGYMKKIIFLNLISQTLITDCFPQSVWQWGYPNPQGNITNFSRFFNTNTGYIGAKSGTIMKIYNGGLN
jgi:hypothetical protein